MDYGNYLYRQKRSDRKHKKQQKKTEVKGVRFSIRTGIHDFEIKAKQATKFLGQNNLVKVNLILKGREFSHKDLAIKKMLEFANMLQEVATIEQAPKMHGHQLTMMLNPIIKKNN